MNVMPNLPDKPKARASEKVKTGMLIIDDRQPESDLHTILCCPAWDRQRVVVRRLDVGDYAFVFYNKTLKEWVTSERWESKTWADLITSMQDGRLTQQLMKLQSCYPGGSGLLIADGPLETWSSEPNPLHRKVRVTSNTGSWHDTGTTVGSVRGYLLTVMSRGCRVVETNQHGGLGYCLAFLHRHAETHRDDVDHFYRGDSAVPIAMLDCIPRISPETAARIYQKWGSSGSLAGITTVSEPDLVQELGPLAGKEVYRRLH